VKLQPYRPAAKATLPVRGSRGGWSSVSPPLAAAMAVLTCGEEREVE
jgi:hypothetical protein